MDLSFQDKRNLQLFDKDRERYLLYLKQARPEELADAAKAAEFRSYAAKLADRLKPLAAQEAHPELASRRAMIAEYEALLESAVASARGEAAADAKVKAAAAGSPAKDLQSMSKDDEHRLKRIEGELEGEFKALRAHEGTVLSGGGKDGSFHAVSARLRSLFANIGATENPLVKALAASLDDYDRLLAEKTAESKKHYQHLSAKGDIRSVIEAFWAELNGPAFPPPPPSPDPKGVSAWAVAMAKAREGLNDAIAHCALADKWAPELFSAPDLKDKVKRILREKARDFDAAQAALIEPWKAALERAAAIAPASLSKDTLVNGAGEESYRLKAGKEAGALLLAYQEAANEKEAAQTRKILSSLPERLKELEALVEEAGREYIAEARMPPALDEPELLEIAKGIIKEPCERLVVTRAVLNHTGEEVQGLFVYASDYDIFWVCAVHKLEDGSYRMWDYSFCYSRKGAPGTVFKQWVMSDNWGGRKILKENIGK